jgi:hypothetical protein
MDQWPAYFPQMAENGLGFRTEQLAEQVLGVHVGRRFRVNMHGAGAVTRPARELDNTGTNNDLRRAAG